MDIVPENISFPATEEATLAYWNKIDAFHTSDKRHEGMPEYSFYDGPPFATGTPHYGHILAGTIKDTVTRYAHMNGFHVRRRFGWDTHGLPIEFEIDKLLGVRTRDQVLEMGIRKYNEACRGIVMRYSAEWEKTVSRLGRWIDFKNDYKTLDPPFMETVWWVFRQLWEKDLVYRGFKVMPYSCACATPLSNFEAGSNYKDRSDPYVIVAFPLINDPNTALAVMTTTPWTLPSNVALCVNPEYNYVKIREKESGKQFILLRNRLSELYPIEKCGEGSDVFEVLCEYKGVDMKGWGYVPMFDYFKEYKEKGGFVVVCDSYVKDDSGTGVVHQAPAFGVDDHRVCLENGILSKGGDIPLPLDANGRFTNQVPEWQGQLVFDANKGIQQTIKQKGRMIRQKQMVHSYPYCWRSDTPLIYRGVPCWFIRVEKIKEQILESQKLTHWVPARIANRFLKWLQGAVDWAVSRNRFWGTPLPLWVNEDFSEVICVGSIDELEKLSGVRVSDLHRENVDDIVIPSQKGNGGVLRRVEEVFDCWFESGSMPYAQVHYPFENEDLFQQSFPADFIAEGVDQTRGWFYTLMVLSTALYGKPAFKNVIVNGLVLAADGKKMSKRLRNYPDPVDVINAYGSDALRLYLVNSPVVHADDLRFREEGVSDVLKDVLLPWFHAYRFLVDASRMLPTPFRPDIQRCLSSKNVMDRWILAAAQFLVKFFHKEMSAYCLYTVIPELVKFIEQLTNWYLRSNRGRMQGHAGLEDQITSIGVMYEALLTMSVVMAPLTPFLAEYFYQNLRKVLPTENEQTSKDDYHVNVDSVHYLPLPKPREDIIDPDVIKSIELLQEAVELARSMRERHTLPLKQPLQQVRVILHHASDVEKLEHVKSYLQDQVKVKEVVLSSDVTSVRATLVPNQKALGMKLRGNRVKVVNALEKMSDAEIAKFVESGTMEVEGFLLTADDVSVQYSFAGGEANLVASASAQMIVVLNTHITPELKEEYFVNQIINYVQKLRKSSGVQKGDNIEIYYSANGNKLDDFLSRNEKVIQAGIKKPFMHVSQRPGWAKKIGEDMGVVDGVRLTFSIHPAAWCCLLSPDQKEAQQYIDMHLATLHAPTLAAEVNAKSQISVRFEGKEYLLKNGETLFASAALRSLARK